MVANRLFCAAAIGSKVGFLISNPTLGKVQVKDHLWPDLAIPDEVFPFAIWPIMRN
jgi:hypothetical protein